MPTSWASCPAAPAGAVGHGLGGVPAQVGVGHEVQGVLRGLFVAARAALQAEFGVDVAGPLAIVVSRLTDQKGIDLLPQVVPDFVAQGGGVIILGSGDPALEAAMRGLEARFPGKVAVGIDARKGFVATKGWATETDVMATDLARSFEDAGVAAIIYTDIDRDGAMQGPNLAATEALARAVSIPVIASGGVSRMEDLLALRDTGVIAGAISGRALYDGRIDPAEALALIKAARG